jgi:adenylate kinase family enzyme
MVDTLNDPVEVPEDRGVGHSGDADRHRSQPDTEGSGRQFEGKILAQGLDSLMSMERVAVVGCSGAGKSTFARELGRRTDTPVIHLDRYYWHPGWVDTPRDDWRIVQRELVSARDRWIADGNYAGTLDERLVRADTVIVLALPRWRCLTRATWRIARHHGQAIQAEGCPERFDLKFLQWIWSYPTATGGRARLNAALGRYPHLKVIELRSPAEVRDFLDEVTSVS